MSFIYPVMIFVAAVVCAALVGGYYWLQRERTKALASAGFGGTRRGWSEVRRYLPPLMFIAAVTILLLAVGRPQATVAVPRVAGTVVLTFDVSNSMTADDVPPSRLAAAKAAALDWAQAQPDTVDIGVVAFGQGALTTHLPTDDRDGALAAIKRLTGSGGTSLGQAILASLSTIVGKQVSLPDPASDAAPEDLGYWGGATIVLLSDGEDTGGPDVIAAAELAAAAGVHIETIGIGTVAGTTIKVDDYQLSTSLNEELLGQVAATTNGSYHRAEDANALGGIYKSLDLRITTQPEFLELTAVAVWLALALLMIGGVLMIIWYGRIL
jgi:Ca-activated chloride channel homolog